MANPVDARAQNAPASVPATSDATAIATRMPAYCQILAQNSAFAGSVMVAGIDWITSTSIEMTKGIRHSSTTSMETKSGDKMDASLYSRMLFASVFNKRSPPFRIIRMQMVRKN